MLRKQRERAIATMSELQTRKDPQSPGMTPEYEEDVKREDEELATLGGKTRLVPRKPSSSTASSPTTASASPRSSPAVSHILPSLPFISSQLSTPPQTNAVPLSTPTIQASQQVAWQPYEYHNNQHHHQYQQHPTAQPVAQAHHAPTHSQPQVSQALNHIPIEHQTHPGSRMNYNHTQYWQQQQAAEYPYNGMHAGPSTTYMPTSPGAMGFDYAASLRAESYLSSVPPMPPQQASRGMQVNPDYSPGTDPSMAWNDLVAQFTGNHV